MGQYPIKDEVRTRLRDAQKAEADALKDVGTAERSRDHARAKLDEAEAALARAQVELVKISGAWRAALLTNESVKLLRRLAREAGLKPDQRA